MASYKIGFLVEQVAGHVSNYRNLRAVVEQDADVSPTFSEIVYHKNGGLFERMPLLPSYVTGIGRASWETFKALRTHKSDAIFCNTTVGVFFGPAFRRCPTLIDLDSTPAQIDSMPAYPSAPDRKPVAKLKWALTRDMFRSAALLHAWSHWAKASAVSDYGIPAERVVVNPPGVNLEFWRPDPDRRRPTQGGPRKVLFVGGDFRRKGGGLLLDWYATQNPAEVELHVVTREQVPNRPGIFVYSDMQPNSPRLLSLYQTSDLFVLPSLGECFGIATVEAMAAGLPVIASDVGGTADIIEPGRNGFIVRANEVAALGEAIGAIVRDGGRRGEMAAQSRVLAEERFDVQKNARRTIQYLKQIADTSRNSEANVTSA